MPEVFGTVMMRSAQYIYGGNIRAQEIIVESEGKKGGSFVAGYAWFASFALALSGTIDAVLEVYRDGKQVWTGNVTANATTIYVQTGVAYEPGGSGTGPSPLRIYLGTQTTADATLAAWTGWNISYKGKAIVICDDAFCGDNSHNAPALDFILKRTVLVADGVGGKTWSTQRNLNVSGNYADANPSHVILYILRNMIGVPDTMIDFDSFHACGQTLATENLGASFLMTTPQAGEHWVQEIIRTVDAAIWHDLVAGKTKMALFRNDYNPATLTELSDNHIKKLTMHRQAWDDFATETTVKYTDRTAFREASIRLKNPAARRMLGYNKPDNYSFMIISNLTALQGVMTRLTKKLFYPLLVCKFSVSRAAFPTLSVGQVIKINSTAFGISGLIVRIANIGSDSMSEQEMDIEAFQDVYGLADLAITSGSYSMATNYDWSVGAIAQARVIDAPAELTDRSAVIVAYSPPEGSPIGVRHYLSTAYAMTGSPRVFGYGVLSGSLAVGGAVQHVNVIQDGVGFYIATGSLNMIEVAATRAAFQRLKFTVAIGAGTSWEFIGYQNCVLQVDGRYYISNLMRGLNNTAISTHSAGEEVWFFWRDANETPTLSVNPASVAVTLQGFNQRNNGVVKDCGAHTYGFLQEKPYPVSNLKGSRVGNDITLTWVPCKRLGLTGYRNPANFAAGNDTPEGSWEVRWGSNVVPVTSTSSIVTYSRTDAGAQTYYVRAVLDGQVSAERSVSL